VRNLLSVFDKINFFDFVTEAGWNVEFNIAEVKDSCCAETCCANGCCSDDCANNSDAACCSDGCCSNNCEDNCYLAAVIQNECYSGAFAQRLPT